MTRYRSFLVHSCISLIECNQVLVWVSAVTVTFLACQLCTGVWSTNLYAPHYGDRDLVGRGYSILPDGSVAPKYIFGGVISGVVIVVAALWTFMWCESYDYHYKMEEDVLIVLSALFRQANRKTSTQLQSM